MAHHAETYRPYCAPPDSYIAGILDRIQTAAYASEGKALRGTLDLFGLSSKGLAAVLRYAPPKRAAILDVGAGTGRLLAQLSSLGYESLTGLEPYRPSSKKPGIRWIRGYLSDEILFQYGFVVFNHSLEHIADPCSALSIIRAHLTSDGTVLIRIPLVAEAFDRYGERWFQIDAPRHSFVPTEQGLGKLAERAGFEVVDSFFDSDEMQFIASELGADTTRSGMPRAVIILTPLLRIFSPRVRALASEARALNNRRRGDQAVFALKKRGGG